jgi:hypothetical protein
MKCRGRRRPPRTAAGHVQLWGGAGWPSLGATTRARGPSHDRCRFLARSAPSPRPPPLQRRTARTTTRKYENEGGGVLKIDTEKQELYLEF